MIFSMMLWGLSWPSGKIVSEYGSIPVSMVWRFFLATVTMVFVLLVTKTTFWVPRGGILPLTLSVILISTYNLSYFMGVRQGAAGAGGVLVTTLNPIFTFALVSLIFREKPGWKSVLGILLGLSGGTILMDVWRNGWDVAFQVGNQYFLMCAGSWAFLTLISSRINEHMSTLTYSFWVYLGSGILALFLTGGSPLLEVLEYDFRYWINLISISLGAMAFATTAYFIATSRLGSEKAAAFIFTVPVSALLFSMLILGEPLKINVLIGGALSITAVYLINSGDAKSRENQSEAEIS
jgi:drug/metabolite transporter (DMT)-like permease